MTDLIHKCMTKATTAEGDQRKHGPNWITSRRALLKVFEDRLECGDWRIQFPEMQSVVLYSFRSFFLRIPGYILTVETDDKTYHFGLNGWSKFWKNELPFAVTREKGKLGFTKFSVAVRALLVAYVLYSIWKWATVA